MGLSREKGVPHASLTRPWTAPANRFQKYFDPQPAAIWAVAAAGQKNAATIDALIGRLDDAGDPLWLRAQIVGALTALTQHRFAYDVEKWRQWWRAARPDWDG
jgi:hypothetical protein